ncbi:hypothetical protein DL762_007569 [Monosporascus cannonballus]|uniref:RanBD1 domain-containing protein n=1 Tax=Monosporascus cannonballus TaxID=155416 RepID=A0ABY0H305_9PEZI|nr:hypothetical protein DL762_007569 [Monosporascus cannonballus]
MNFLNATTPRKRPAPGEPGSTPFSSSKFQSSLVPMNRPTPSRSYHPPKNKSKPIGGFSSNSRDLFRTSTPQANRTSTFSPDLPPAVTKATPTARKFVSQKNVGAGMSSTTSTELFKMRISSPDPELTGEALSKQVPDDPNRTGTIYADQYLADKCPPHFDDLQRRQFFCILDLRRLKYAANEIFLKKDWKLNILNFAKEYEKSRGLILLRYGLYEFKKVKPSAEVLKKWRAAHGLPNPEPEEKTETNGDNSTTRQPGSPTKRKADEDLAPKDNALMASTANQNKRRNVDRDAVEPVLSGPSPFKKSKRKADEAEELDENQPSKVQKQPTSAVKSKFESILDRAQSAAGSPPRRPPLSAASQSTPFGAQKTGTPQTTDSTPKPNPFAIPSNNIQSGASPFSKTTNGNGASDSVLAGHKPGSSLSTNTGMFGYLSGSSANNSGNEKDDAEEEDVESESGSERGTESQDAAPSYEPSAAASTGTSTPPAQNGMSLFSSNKSGGASTPFSDFLNKAVETPAKGGLFDRVKLDADGQPMRATPGLEEKETSAPEVSTPAPAPTKTQARTPGDFRFDPTTTPISFSQSSSTSTPAKPPMFSSARASDTPKETPKEAPKEASVTEDVSTPKPPPIFGPTSQTSSRPSTSSKPLFGENNNASNIFQAKPPESAKSIFEAQKPAENAASIFGTPKPVENASSIFGAPKPTDNASSLFGAQKSTGSSDQTSTTPARTPLGGLFGNKAESQPSSAQEQSKSLFATPSTGTSTGLFGKPANSQDTTSGDQSKNLFGTPSTNATPALFGKQAEPKPSDAQGQPKNLFGADSTTTTPLTQGQPKNLFGAASTTATPQSTKRSFEEDTGEPSAKRSMFGGDKSSTSSFFGANSTTNSPAGFTFGGSNNQTSASPIFNGFKPETTNGTSNAPQGANNIFGATPAKPSSDSDVSKPAPAAPIFSFGSTSASFGKSSTETDKAAPFTFNASQPASPQPNQNGFASTSGVFGNTTPSSGPNFGFRGASPGPSAPPGRKIATPKRRLGGSQTPNTSFNAGAQAGQPPLNASFSFGNTVSGTTSAASSFAENTAATSFEFTPGKNGQSMSNPFAQSNGHNSTSTFGNNASAPSPTPFQFGQQTPSTPNATTSNQGAGIFSGSFNGTDAAPSFKFDAATPQPNTPNLFAPKPTGLFGNNNLQPGGDGSAGAASPMPAPSSLGTTPVNGTPEPQAHNEDGEEAPEEQISLTDGGPGEEDENILHEVRAKAIKYVPVTQGEEGGKPESPWRTQGVGPLRILKNKTTGSVRILLRAEPRGHIAMNKVLLADIEYKAKDKTISFAASKDDGSGLETWVLQVKKPEFAVELATVMEANKSANKK